MNVKIKLGTLKNIPWASTRTLDLGDEEEESVWRNQFNPVQTGSVQIIVALVQSKQIV